MVKRWLLSQTIVLEKRPWWFNRTGKINSSNILNLTAQGGSVFLKPPPFANYATSVWTFRYPDGSRATNLYTATITYEWSARFSGIQRKFQAVILTGP
ncbi:MAG: hypothetical protein WCT12_06510 [Verrucomicrobiota bacterium]